MPSFRFAPALILLVIVPASVSAQPSLEEIIVTADYRQQSVDDIASSITVIDTATMERKNAQHLEDVILNAANVNFSSGASRARFFQIRGIGERGQFVEPMNSSVGLMIDGVDFSGIGTAAMLYDTEQVEILMGPQGTRYGSNALAGLINLQSKVAATEQETGLQLQAANENSRAIAGYVSGPATDDLFYRLSGQELKSDGPGRNLYLGRHTNQKKETTLRGKFRWLMTPTETLEFTTAMVDVNNGYDAFSLDNIRDTLSDQPGFDRQDSDLASLKFTSSHFDFVTLEALGGFAQSDIEYGYDEDWVYTGFHPWEYSSIDHYFRDRKTGSMELRLVSGESGALFGGRTAWVAGIYSLHQEVKLDRYYTFLPAVFTSHYNIDRLALYADTTTVLNDSWSLDLGLRSEHFEADYNDNDGLSFTPDDDLWGGKFTLNHHLENGGLIYAGISRGYKSGGFNTDGSLDADLREFNSESLWNYEAGFKGEFAEGRLLTRLALFYMDRNNIQISSSIVRARNDGSSEFIDFIGNAASGFNRGLELSGQWLASDRVILYGSLGLLDSEYRDFINSAGEDLDGREQAHAPGYQFTLGATVDLSNNLVLDINLQGRDKFYFSDSHSVQSKSYALLNASLRYDRNNMSFTLWGRNLTDKNYFVRGFWFGNDPRDGYTPKGYTQLGEPARFGLTVNLDF